MAADPILEPLRADPAAGAMLCDIDGTLAPIVDDPEAAERPAGGTGGARRARRPLPARRLRQRPPRERRPADGRPRRSSPTPATTGSSCSARPTTGRALDPAARPPRHGGGRVRLPPRLGAPAPGRPAARGQGPDPGDPLARRRRRRTAAQRARELADCSRRRRAWSRTSAGWCWRCGRSPPSTRGSRSSRLVQEAAVSARPVRRRRPHRPRRLRRPARARRARASSSIGSASGSPRPRRPAEIERPRRPGGRGAGGVPRRCCGACRCCSATCCGSRSCSWPASRPRSASSASSSPTRTPTSPALALAAGWWVAARRDRVWLGRPSRAAEAIARVLAGARTATSLPPESPGRIAIMRLWPIGAFALVRRHRGHRSPRRSRRSAPATRS